jgi:hypothetical protein
MKNTKAGRYDTSTKQKDKAHQELIKEILGRGR